MSEEIKKYRIVKVDIEKLRISQKKLLWIGLKN